MDFLKSIGGFISDPGPGVVIAFTWIFGPLITFAGVQRLKRLAHASGCKWTPLRIEAIATVASLAISWLIMFGLYAIPPRLVVIHSVLIAWVYMVAVNWWLSWTKEHRPDLYNALRTERRQNGNSLDDTGEFRL